MSMFQINKPIRRSFVRAGAAMTILFGALAIESTTLAVETDTSAKGMRVVKGSETSGLSVEIEPLRDRYEVDEPMRFRIRGNESFYVYLYTLDEKTGDSLLIFPNEIERDNHYPGGRSFLVPNRAAEFYADQAGSEQLVMVASTRDLGIPLDRLATDRHFYSARSADLEGMLSAQGIRIERDDRSRVRDARAKDMVVKRIELDVTGNGDGYAKSPAEDAPTALVSTAREQYRSGETFDLVFGANRDGWVSLYAVEPGGAFERLVREEVRADMLESLSVRAEAPHGWHRLVAVYSPRQRLDRVTEEDILGDGDRIAVPDDSGLAVSSHRIRVVR